ncbi:MAG: response regulator [Comamonadaceae bacterium]|nr:response regulator [Comamonadaceae bacterium]
MNDSSFEQFSFLVIDDDDFSCDIVSSALNAIGGTRIHCAKDSQNALSLARQYPPDFVLLDIYMPQTDGWTLLGQLRRLAPNAAIVMVTGSSTPADFRKSMDEQADGYCIKPVSSMIMRKTLMGARLRRQAGHQSVH